MNKQLANIEQFLGKNKIYGVQIKYVLALTAVFTMVLTFIIVNVSQADQPPVIVEDSFEEPPVFGETDSTWREVNISSATIFDQPVRAGDSSVRISLNYDDDWNKPSSELRLRHPNEVHHFDVGKEYWYGISIYLPADYADHDVGDTLMQFHNINNDEGPKAPGNPPLSLRTENNRWVLKVRGDTRINPEAPWEVREHFDLGAIEKGTWVDWVLHVKWNVNGNGYTQLWRDGQQLVDYNGINAFNGLDRGPYLKIGVYIPAWNHGPTNISGRTVFYDEVRVTDDTGSYAAVAPGSGGGGTEPTPQPPEPTPVPPEPTPVPPEPTPAPTQPPQPTPLPPEPTPAPTQPPPTLPPDPGGRVTADLQVFYTFSENGGQIVYDQSGVGTPANLNIADMGAVQWQESSLVIRSATSLITDGGATKIATACQANNEITMEAWVSPAAANQLGPAHILSMTAGNRFYNFMLGQGLRGSRRGDLYVTNLETSNVSGNGRPTLTSYYGSATTELTHVLYTRNSAGTVRIYINGQLERERRVPGDFSTWGESFPFIIGNNITGNMPWLGEMHLAAVYCRALSETEVNSNFLAGP